MIDEDRECACCPCRFRAPPRCRHDGLSLFVLLNPDAGFVRSQTRDTAGSDSNQQSEVRPGAMDFQLIVEQCVRPLVEEVKVKAQALALAEKDRIIEDQSRQLRLLPDFQKRAEDEKARAEEERKAAELRALEIEALNKQLAAREAEKEQLETKVNEAAALASDLEALKQTVTKLQTPWYKKIFGGG